jgi:hypothetical protein
MHLTLASPSPHPLLSHPPGLVSHLPAHSLPVSCSWLCSSRWRGGWYGERRGLLHCLPCHPPRLGWHPYHLQRRDSTTM